ncbi:unnamed protein product, partial [Amoebophrya sp. A25]
TKPASWGFGRAEGLCLDKCMAEASCPFVAVYQTNANNKKHCRACKTPGSATLNFPSNWPKTRSFLKVANDAASSTLTVNNA